LSEQELPRVVTKRSGLRESGTEVVSVINLRNRNTERVADRSSTDKHLLIYEINCAAMQLALVFFPIMDIMSTRSEHGSAAAYFTY